jgi:predicted ATPase/DNA-binding winged helix-turn-helix (wHTH) protein
VTRPRPIAQDFLGAQAGIRVNVLGGVDNVPAAAAEGAISFGPFRLLPGQQLLLEDGKPVRIGSRALEILLALIENAGTVVSKQELIARTWPNIFVDEGNLRVHVAALRKALGDGQTGRRFIANVAGRGYCFVAPIERSEVDRSAPSRASTPLRDMPGPASRMIGRVEVVNALVAQLPQKRLITLAGPAGIGKTTVAHAVAQASTHRYPDGISCIDLAAVAESDLVDGVIASALGIVLVDEAPIQAVTAFLRDKQMLLVLDGCERVLDAAGRLVEEILRNAPGAHILATSRERLRATGEFVQRLAPLAAPPASAELTAGEALAFAAVRLFVERAAVHLGGYELSDADVPIVSNICRKLDGIALAIEVAASRIEAFGIRGLAAILDDRFPLSMRGRRTALPRHQTLAAALDWSYEVLPESERLLLRRLAVFTGDFTLESAIAIAADAEHDGHYVVDGLSNLVAKSLVTADVGGPVVQYRLFNTTRIYARLKLAESGELDDVVRRHAEYDQVSSDATERVSGRLPAAPLRPISIGALDDLRAA